MNVRAMKRLASGLSSVFLILWCASIVLCVLAGVFTLTGAFGLNLQRTVSLDVPIRVEYRGDAMPAEIPSESWPVRFEGAPVATLAVPLSMIRTPERFCLLAALFCNVVTMYMLVAFLRDVRAGRPFQPENVRRVRWVGVTLILSGLFGDASGYILANRLLSGPWFSGMRASTSFDPDFGFLVIGMLIVLFAEVFRLGVQLQQEQDLTV